MSNSSSSQKIKVDGKPITVFKAGFIHGLQRSIRIAEAGKNIPKFYEKLDLSPEIIRYVHTLLYPSLISCSEGKVPTEERFLYLDDDDANRWIDAAQKINPDWFSLNVSPAEKEAAEKNG